MCWFILVCLLGGCFAVCLGVETWYFGLRRIDAVWVVVDLIETVLF